MYCNKCGKEIVNSSKFCDECESKISPESSTLIKSLTSLRLHQNNLDTFTIICIGLVAVTLLSMILLPMFELIGGRNFTISLLGENYMANHGCRNDIVVVSRITFIFMFVFLVATIIFNIYKKYAFSFLSSFINLLVIIFYIFFVGITWSSAYHSSGSIPKSGYILCLASSFALMIITYVLFLIKTPR